MRIFRGKNGRKKCRKCAFTKKKIKKNIAKIAPKNAGQNAQRIHYPLVTSAGNKNKKNGKKGVAYSILLGWLGIYFLHTVAKHQGFKNYENYN